MQNLLYMSNKKDLKFFSFSSGLDAVQVAIDHWEQALTLMDNQSQDGLVRTSFSVRGFVFLRFGLLDIESSGTSKMAPTRT